MDTSSNLLITEEVVNADGLTVEARHATLDGQAWTPTDGYTAYQYGDYDEAGSNGWDEWALQPWARRFNLARVTYHAARHPDMLNFAHSWDSLSGGLSGEEIVAREVNFEYEPIFNQVARVKHEAILASGQRDLLSHTIYTFDYEEFYEKSAQFKEALWRVKGWNMRPHKDDLETILINSKEQYVPSDRWVENVLRVPFYGHLADFDLNGDDLRGFPHPEDEATPIFKGFVIRRTQVDVSDASGTAMRTDAIWPAPHGLPARLVSASGQDTMFEYYSFDTERFGTWPLSDSDLSIYNRGLLGRVHTRQHRNAHRAESGAFDAGDLLGQGSSWQSCEELKGAYAWLMPEGCSGQDASSWLTQLGVPGSVANGLLDASSEADNWSTTTMIYNGLGHVQESFIEGARVATWTRDSDGLIAAHLDAESTLTTYYRDAYRNVTKEMTADAQGQLVHQVQRQFDLEGHLMTECTDVTAHGCANVMSAAGTLSYDAPRDLEAPAYLLETYRYTPEGQLSRSKDAAELERQVSYDGRGLVTEEVYAPGTGKERRTRFVHDARGRLVRREYGSTATRQSLGAQDELFEYDGFGQLRAAVQRSEMTQTSGDAEVSWQFARDARGALVAERLSDYPYTAASVTGEGQLGQETLIAYDGYGRPVVSQTNGLQRTTIEYDERGQVRKRQVQSLDHNGDVGGEGEITWMAYDAEGRLGWTLDREGDMSVALYDVPNRSVSNVTLRRDEREGTWLATTSEQRFDERGDRTDVLITGALGELQPTIYEHDALGRVTARTTADQQTSRTDYNMVGWVERFIEPQDAGQMTPETSYLYNARGQILALTEPGQPNETTRYTFNSYGERTSRQLPGLTSAFDEYDYDGYGRLSEHRRYSENGSGWYATHRYEYEQLFDGGTTQRRTVERNDVALQGVDRELAYDQLGRLLSAKDYNLKASYLLEMSNPRAITRSYSYDPLGRALTERQVIAEGSQTLQDEMVQRAFTALGNAGLWQERTTYPSGTVWEREFAQGGRLRHAERVSRQGGRSSAEIEVDWVGELYAGRRQQYDSNVEPIVERKAFDGLGRVQQWEYRAVSLDAQGNPTSSGPWPKAYCHGSWQSDCELPLYATSLRYDTMNRLRGVTRRFGHPVVEQGQLRSASEHKRAWRGYDYSHRGFLSHEWQGEELSNAAAFNVIANHSDPQHSDHDAVAAASQGKQWLWERNETGDLEEIRAGARHKGASRWAHTNTQTQDARRTARHKLDQVETPALGPVTVEHDERGRVALDAGFEYEHGADDRLIQAEERSGTGGSGREIYFYDGRGELAQVVRQSAPGLAGEEHFVYDGVHKVASYQDGQLKWEAFFGAGLDRLLLLDDVQGGEDYVTLGDERRNIIGMWKNSSKQLEGLARYSAQGHRTTLATNGAVECDEEAYGAAVCEQQAGVMPFGFNAAWRSPMTGLSQMRHRWYSPGLNQFLSHDPLEHIDSYNLYAFAGHDPVNFRDPFGLEKGGLLDMARRFGSRVMDWFGSDTGQKVMAVGVGLVNIGMGTAEIFVGVGATMTGAGALAGVPIAAIGADTLITGLETLMTGQIQKTMVEEVATEAALAAGAEPETAETLGALADVASGVATLGTNKAATHLARRSAQRLAAKNAGKTAGKNALKTPKPTP